MERRRVLKRIVTAVAGGFATAKVAARPAAAQTAAPGSGAPAEKARPGMQYNRLGDSGLVVSKLTFGGGSLGVGQTLPGLNKNVDQKTSIEMVARCLDAGITMYDVADIYVEGQSEIMLGKALGARRKDIVLATKGGGPTGSRDWNKGGLSARHLIEACENSLRRLGTDWVDVYYCHSPDRNTPLEETARAYDHLVRSGKARYVAVCNYPAWMAARMQGIQAKAGYAPIVCNQIYYSLLGRIAERELVPMARATGLGIVGYEALAGGFLTGKYTRENPAPAGTRRATFTLAPKFDLEKGFDLLDAIKEMAPRYRATPAQISIAWAMSRPWMNSVIFGVSKMEQLIDNLGATQFTLAEEDIARLEKMTTPAE